MISLPLIKLQALSLAGSLPHAWLFVSAELTSAENLALEFSKWQLCNNKQDANACGVCKACNLFVAHAHPDFYKVTPAADKTTISIDAVRLAIEYVVSKPQLSSHKIVLIYPAEAMPKQAANALLKNLEEPCGNTLYILLTKHRALLMPTIISRCQSLQLTYRMAEPASIQAITKQITVDLSKLWIEKSLTVIQIVDAWIKQWPNEVLYCFEVVVTDLIRFKYTQDQDLAKYWCIEQVALSKQLTSNKFWAILERLRLAQYWLGKNQKPNMQLLLEDMLLV